MKCPHCGEPIETSETMSRAGPVMKSVYEQVKLLRPDTPVRADDFNIGNLGSRMQLYNALHELVRQGFLAKAGYGKFRRGNRSVRQVA